jgi:hypothetical protein
MKIDLEKQGIDKNFRHFCENTYNLEGDLMHY